MVFFAALEHFKPRQVMGGASVVCFWKAKSGSEEVASWLLLLWEGNRRWQINLKRLDYLSTAEFYVKGVRRDEMK